LKGSQADAKRYALRLLNYRPRSRKEMLQRLKQKGFDDPVTKDTVEYLERAGLINDELLAEGLLRHAVEKKHLGRRGAEFFLYKRGIERGLAAKVLSSHTEDTEKEAAIKLVQSRMKTMGHLPEKAIRRRLYAMLQRRGFRPDIIMTTVNSAVK
jgi:regulatory protein